MSLDLCTLTPYARTRPAPDIRVDTSPYKPSGDQFLGGSNAGVGETME